MGRGYRGTVQLNFRIDPDIKEEIWHLVPEIRNPMGDGFKHGGLSTYLTALIINDLRQRRTTIEEHTRKRDSRRDYSDS